MGNKIEQKQEEIVDHISNNRVEEMKYRAKLCSLENEVRNVEKIKDAHIESLLKSIGRLERELSVKEVHMVELPI